MTARSKGFSIAERGPYQDQANRMFGSIIHVRRSRRGSTSIPPLGYRKRKRRPLRRHQPVCWTKAVVRERPAAQFILGNAPRPKFVYHGTVESQPAYTSPMIGLVEEVPFCECYRRGCIGTCLPFAKVTQVMKGIHSTERGCEAFSL